VLFGDHQDDGTARLDARLRALAAEGKLRYAYRHFPADQKCNPTVPRSFHPLACRLARTAEAAGQVAGDAAFWKVHAFILEHHQAYTDADLRTFAATETLDAAAILKARDGPEASAAVEEDVAAGKALGVTELPWLIVNGRRVPRWEWDGKDILDALIAETAAH
jgi:protein-disulfide isomerase